MENVRNPHYWNKWIAKAEARAAMNSSRCRSLLYTFIDLGVYDERLAALQREHAAIYKLLRLARREGRGIARKELVALYDVIVNGPTELKTVARVFVEAMDE